MIHYVTTQGIGQPWVGNELRVIDREGIPFVLHAMRRPEHELFDSTWAARINRDTRTIYPIAPIGMLLSIVVAPLLFRGGFVAALGNALFGGRESRRARVGALSHLFVACHWARVNRHEAIDHIHAQWAHSAASIAMYGAWLLDRSFSFTGHAVDIFRDRVALRDKIRRAEFIICISRFHRDVYLREGARPEQLHIAYCGINVDEFAPSTRDRPAGETYRVLAAGRLVEKKGFAHLLDACARLAARGERFECVIAGSGELENALRQQVDRLELADHVEITGRPLKQEDIPSFMHGGDIFCLPCVWATDNDVDGLPQLLMEAMACGLPAISTAVAGIPDLIEHDRTGLLVEAGNAAEIADAIAALAADRARSRRLADAGRAFVVERFNLTRSLDPLVAQFQRRIGDAGPHCAGAPAPAPSLGKGALE